MSDLSLDRLNIDDVVARIERQQAETRKFVAEQAKLISKQTKFAAEQAKFGAEQAKLFAEAAKLQRDRSLAPWQIALTVFGTGTALLAAGGALVKLFG